MDLEADGDQDGQPVIYCLYKYNSACDDVRLLILNHLCVQTSLILHFMQ